MRVQLLHLSIDLIESLGKLGLMVSSDQLAVAVVLV